MLIWLAEYLTEFYSGFNVFKYLTLRTVLAALTGLFIALFMGSTLINWLKKLHISQNVRLDGPNSHIQKSGTPTMGGLLILAAMTISTLCWANLHNRFIAVILLVTLAFGIIGWVDDHRKIIHKDPNGLPARIKFFWQSIIGFIAAIYLYQQALSPTETELIIPFVKNVILDLGWAYVVFAYLVIVGASNAVNLSDGLDGLAILPIILVAGALGVFAYTTGNIQFAKYLAIPYVSGVGEVSVFCASIVGAGLGFLWFNTYPAQVFMGDVGSLALGAALGIVAVVVRQELVFFLMAGIFVVETLSVIVQVASYKLTGRRVFRMAPLHHHYELKGWPEPRVIVRFWIITVILVLIGLSSLKIR